nr:hypothetical protein [Candidatus Sigynarchaeum springense]
MDPADFFVIADRIVERWGSEAALEHVAARTAVNRLYFGVLHQLRLHLSIHVPGTDVTRYHAFVKGEVRRRAPSIRSWLAQLEAYRVRADYMLGDKGMGKDAAVHARALKEAIMQEMTGDTGDGSPGVDDNDDKGLGGGRGT